MHDKGFVTDINVDLKSDRINDDVALLMGCTLQEIMSVAILSVGLGLLFGMSMMEIMVGSLMWGIPFGIIFFIILFVLILSRFSKLKRDKPSGYYQQYMKMKLSKYGIIKCPYIIRSGKWSTNREYEI